MSQHVKGKVQFVVRNILKPKSATSNWINCNSMQYLDPNYDLFIFSLEEKKTKNKTVLYAGQNVCDTSLQLGPIWAVRSDAMLLRSGDHVSVDSYSHGRGPTSHRPSPDRPPCGPRSLGPFRPHQKREPAYLSIFYRSFLQMPSWLHPRTVSSPPALATFFYDCLEFRI